MKLSVIVILGFLVILGTTSFIGSLVFFNSVSSIISNEADTHIITTVQTRAEHIDSIANMYKKNVEIISKHDKLAAGLLKLDTENDILVAEAKKHLLEELKNHQRLDSAIQEIILLDTSGQLIISTRPSREKIDFSSNPIYQKGKSEPSVCDCVQGDNTISASSPIKHNNRLLGVLITVMNLEEIKSAVEHREGLGEFGTVLILNSYKLPVDNSKDVEFNLSNRENIDQCYEHRTNPFELHKPIISKKSSRKIISSHAYIESINWCLITEIDYDEVIGSKEREMIKVYFTIMIWVIVGLLAVGFILSRILTNPIKNITKIVDQIISGHLEATIPSSFIFEYQKLTDSLNKILSSLKLAVLKVGIKKQELELGEVLKAKEQAEQEAKNFKEILDNSNYGYIMTKIDGTITYVNKYWSEIHGFGSPGDMISKNIDINHTPEQMTTFKKIMELGLKEGGFDAIEIEHKNKKGETFTMLMNGKIMTDTDGEKFFAATGIDISDRVKEQDKIKQKTAQLERFAKLSVGREERMITLKKKVEELEAKLEKARKKK